jgi:urease accessory protein UreE
MSAAKDAHAIGNQFADCQRARGAVRRQHAKVQQRAIASSRMRSERVKTD